MGTPSLTGKLDSGALFSGGAVLQYTNQPNDAVVLQAVHLGTQQLTITSSDDHIKPVKITLSVEDPQSLGASYPDFDPGLYPLADDTGLPPQMIKGQIETEGRFNPMAWRYEPFNDEVGDFAVSNGPDLRAQTPYSALRLPTIGDRVNPGNCGANYDYASHIDSRIPDRTACPGLAQGGIFRCR